MKAEVGDLDARELRGLDQVEVLGHLDRSAVEDDRERVLGGRRRGRGRKSSRGGLVAGSAHGVGGRRSKVEGRRSGAEDGTPDRGPTRHRFCSTWWRNSSRNLPTEERTG